MVMNNKTLRPRQLQGVPIYTARLGMKFLYHNNNGSSCGTSTTANAAGAWVQFVANNVISASETINALYIRAVGNNQVAGENANMLLDIGIGASGSEVVVVSGISVGGGANSGGAGPVLPIAIKIAGATRIAFRVRGALTVTRYLTIQNVIVSGQIANSAFSHQLPTTLTVLGTDAATSAGTALSGVSGTFTEIIASTTEDYQAITVVPSANGINNTGVQAYFTLSLATGAAGQETVVAYSWGSIVASGAIYPVDMTASTTMFGGLIPAGTRLSVSHNLPTLPARMATCVIGVPFPP